MEAGDDFFLQFGIKVYQQIAAANQIKPREGRILDYVLNGQNDHLPDFLMVYREMVKAIRFLHDQGQKHGDIRRDHILLDRKTGDYRWIDFDYDYYHAANMFGYDIFGLGNILIFLVGGGDITIQQLQADKSPLLEKLAPDDMNIIFNNRVANIQKIYPYVPDALNYILLHFSQGANLYYESTGQLLTDLEEIQIKGG